MKSSKVLTFLGLCVFGASVAGCAEDIVVPEVSDDALGQAPEAAHAYPAGPYGIAVGSVIADLKFSGFHNAQISADVNALETISLHEFYNPTGTDTYPADSSYRPGEAKPKTIWIDVSAQWCGPCKDESKTVLPAKYAKYQPMGGELILELIEDTAGDPAQGKNLLTWTTQYKTAWPATIDPSRQIDAFFEEGAYPTNILIDARTMTIVDVVAGAPTTSFYKKMENILNE